MGPDHPKDVSVVDAYADMFELAPVSLWLEDFSALKTLYARWRDEGVTDLRAHLHQHPDLVAECSRCLKVLRVNRRTLDLFEADSLEHLVNNLDKVFRDDMLELHIQELRQLWDGQLQFASQTVNYTLGGRRLSISLKATVLPGHEDTWARVLLAIEDLTERNRANMALQTSERYAKGLFEHSPVSLWVEDFSTIRQMLAEVRQQGVEDFRVFLDVYPEFVVRCMQEIRVLDVNQQTLKTFRARDKQTLLSNLEQVFRGDMRQPFAEQLIDLWNGKLFQQREVINYALDGEAINVYLQFSVLPGHEERWDRVLISLTDITARKKAEAYLEYLGRHDALTGLHNRTYFSDEVNRLDRRGPWPVSMVAIDVNDLKTINDEGGHASGDALLRRVGEVLREAVKAPITASRIGGDEFAILLPGVDERGCELLVEQLHELLALNNQFNAGSPPLSLSIGRATGGDKERLDAVLHRADEQMYLAKREYYAKRGHDRRAG